VRLRRGAMRTGRSCATTPCCLSVPCFLCLARAIMLLPVLLHEQYAAACITCLSAPCHLVLWSVGRLAAINDYEMKTLGDVEHLHNTALSQAPPVKVARFLPSHATAFLITPRHPLYYPCLSGRSASEHLLARLANRAKLRLPSRVECEMMIIAMRYLAPYTLRHRPTHTTRATSSIPPLKPSTPSPAANASLTLPLPPSQRPQACLRLRRLRWANPRQAAGGTGWPRCGNAEAPRHSDDPTSHY
jgi:hypothetical protein